MSFADFDYKSEEEIRGDVLRAFGQALGLELESRNINFAPQWSSNVNRVKSYWELDIEDVTWDVIKQYVFDPLDADNAISTDEYDALSIMRWPFPGNILLNGGPSAGTANTELSELDKEFIAELYPKDYLAKFVIDFHRQYPEFYLGLGVDRDNAVFIDWGNGEVTAASPGDPFYRDGTTSYSTIYDDLGEYTITIYGDAEALYSLCPMSVVWGRYLVFLNSLDVSGCTNLRELLVAGNNYTYTSDNVLSSLDLSNCPLLERLTLNETLIETIDLSHNPLLKYFRCSGNLSLTNLDLSHSPLLEELYCTSNKLTSLDVSHNPLLVSLDCQNSQLTSLDVSNNPLLRTLYCSYNQLTNLDVSNNPLLASLNCYHNQLTSLDISHNPLLWVLKCYDNPFISDQAAVVALANALPDCRDLNVLGSLDVGSAWDWVSAICVAKQWEKSVYN